MWLVVPLLSTKAELKFLIKSFCPLLDCKHMTLEIRKRKWNMWNISFKWIKETDKNVFCIRVFTFHYLTFWISDQMNYFLKKFYKIKIFIKSNQFFFNILPHEVIKTYRINDFTMSCTCNKVTQFSVRYYHLKYPLCKIWIIGFQFYFTVTFI